jgi:aminoglycoside phosphotransferase (APT) family kinase protein
MRDGSYRKLVRAGRAEGLAVRHRRLAELLGSAADVPAVLGVADGWVDLAALPGRPILGAERAAWDAAGRALSVLRRTDPVDLPLHDAAAEAATTVRWLTAAADAGRLPRIDPRPLLVPLLARPGPTCAAHRDLHDGQLLWDGARLGVLDADTLARAEPALDLANLLVHLELRELQGLLPAAAHRDAEAAVLAAAAPDPGLHARTEAYAQATRLRLAAVHAFRPRWADAARALLARGSGASADG